MGSCPAPAKTPFIVPAPGFQPASTQRRKEAPRERIYANRDLKMTSIQWIGFDMDYTLAVYNQEAMDALSVELTAERLIRRGYPGYLRDMPYDHRFSIRGLLVDKKLGNILKMNRFKVVRKGYHGTRPLEKSDLLELYNHRRIRPQMARYHWIDTLFSLSEVTSFAAIIDSMERHGERCDFPKLFTDIRESIDEAHRDGSVYREVLADMSRFIQRDPYLAPTLHKLRSAGKRMFLLTNSPWSYTDRVMDFLLGQSTPDYPSWRHFFDVVIVSAKKPLWFQEGDGLMLRDGEKLRPIRGGLDRLSVYEGGNLLELERRLDLLGSTVLYVGDHIYGDMLRSKKESAWRTAMIIPELDDELEAHEASSDLRARRTKLEETREALEDELRYEQLIYKELTRSVSSEEDIERARAKTTIDRLRRDLRLIDAEHSELRKQIDRRFHPYWGSLLKERNERSIFGLQVETYADIYMRRVSCLRHYSPSHFYRAPHHLMPHER